MQLNAILIGILAALSLSLPGVFKSDHLADWQNGLIALVLVALFSFLTVLLGGEFTSNFAADWVLFAGVYGALLAGPAKPLDQWLQTHAILPFLKPATPGSVAPAPPTPASDSGPGK